LENSSWRETIKLLPSPRTKRIKEENITITLKQRNIILDCLTRGDRFIQIGKYTLMVNSIKSIDPYYEPDNIPLRPQPQVSVEIIKNKAIETLLNKDQLDLWDRLYKDKLDI